MWRCRGKRFKGSLGAPSVVEKPRWVVDAKVQERFGSRYRLRQTLRQTHFLPSVALPSSWSRPFQAGTHNIHLTHNILNSPPFSSHPPPSSPCSPHRHSWRVKLAPSTLRPFAATRPNYHDLTIYPYFTTSTIITTLSFLSSTG